jgi:hypothetical protein
MADVTHQLLREFAEMRSTMADLAAGQTAFIQRIFDLQREMVRVKDDLARIDDRVRKLEGQGAEER